MSTPLYDLDLIDAETVHNVMNTTLSIINSGVKGKSIWTEEKKEEGKLT